MQNLVDTLLIFNKFSIEMGYRTIAMIKAEAFDIKKALTPGIDMAILTALMDMIILDACSYLDEYNKKFGVTTEEKYKQKILEIKTICKPLISQINKWKDLRLIRNSFIAHNLRTKDNIMIFRTQMSYEAPRGPYEVELLNHIIQIIDYIIFKEFANEIDYARKNFQLEIPAFKGFSHEDCWQIVNRLIDDINRKLAKYNKSYKINFK